MKSREHHEPISLVIQGVAIGVLLFILVGVFHVIPSDFSDHIKIETHWSSATPVLQIPFEEKDKEDSEDELDATSSHHLSVRGYSFDLGNEETSYPMVCSPGLFQKLPFFLSLRTIRI